MFAARFRWSPNSQAESSVVERLDVSRQVVRIPTGSGRELGVQVPLVPITSFRTVHSALGNILKRFEVGGEEVPASKELEEVVPRLLQERSKRMLGDIQGPLSVWALVVPARLAGRWRPGLMESLDFQPMFREGCRLHKVLSGGGGWGAKQGLLSLDPEAKFSTTDEEDVESFERDFLANREGGGGGGSIVGPGDEVMFCVDTATFPLPALPAAKEALRPKGFVVKVGLETTEAVPNSELQLSTMERVDGFFGVVSTAMFVAPTVLPGRDGPVASMKIDTPGAELFMEGLDILNSVEEKSVQVEGLQGASGEELSGEAENLVFRKVNNRRIRRQKQGHQGANYSKDHNRSRM